MLYDTIEKLTVIKLTGNYCHWVQNPEIFKKRQSFYELCVTVSMCSVCKCKCKVSVELSKRQISKSCLWIIMLKQN